MIEIDHPYDFDVTIVQPLKSLESVMFCSGLEVA